MASTANFLLLLCALFALVLLVSAEVSTSVDMREISETNGVEDAKSPSGGYPGGGYPGGGDSGRGKCRYGCCHSYNYGHGCHKCCAHANEVPDAIFEDDAHN